MTNRARRRPVSLSATPVTLTIESLGAQGDGIARHGDRPVYVPMALPGERVRVRPDAVRGDGVAAVLDAVLEPSPERVSPPCPSFGRCGGCALQHWAEPAIAAWKREVVAIALGRAGLDAVPVAPTLDAAPLNSRRRATLAVIGRKGVPAVLGLTARAGSEIIPPQGCVILARPILDALPALAAGLGPLLRPRERADLAVTSTVDGLDMLMIRGRAPDLEERQALAVLAERLDLARLSWSTREGSAPEPLLRRRPARIAFAERLVEPPPGGFLQATAEGQATLTALVLEAAKGARAVADLYAGAGTFALPLALGGAKVHAVEGDAALLAALRVAGKDLALSVERRDLAKRPLLAHELKGLDAVVLDPPRAGAAAQVRELATAGPPLVVHVSCNPATFARDARSLTEGGYVLEAVTPIDQFRFSPHVELVGVFRRG